MIKVEKLSYDFPQKVLYEKVSFEIENRAHCALIGTNGTGKSTLIDIIINPEKYLYDGKIIKDDNCKIGYVSQFYERDENESATVFEYLSAPFVKLQNKISEICLEMGKEDNNEGNIEEIYDRYQRVLDEFSSVDGDFYESNISKQLDTAKLTSILELPISQVSGGEFKLVQVIKAMLFKPSVLIMDEPDVFLDFEHLNALRDLINGYKGTILVITHNRYLLNTCFNKIIHLENTKVREFAGTYIEYNFKLLKEKIEVQEQAVKDQEEIDRNKGVLNKMRANATAMDNASLGRSVHARDSIVKRLEARKTDMPFIYVNQPEINFATDIIIGEENILEVDDYNLVFDETLLENVNFQIGATSKVAIVGPNGTGKTSLLRDIIKQYNTESSNDELTDIIKLADNVQIGFLSQKQSETINENNTILEEFYDLGFEKEQEVVEYLRSYSFDEEMIQNKISTLSGGEKNLLQLAKLSKVNNNLLLLDEPTSHLDTYAQVEFEKAISKYQGAVLMVSHDFYTIANSMDYILILEKNTIRKISIRKFRKMIYANHFNKDYLEIEQKKKELEARIEKALSETDFNLAKEVSSELENIISQISKLSRNNK